MKNIFKKRNLPVEVYGVAPPDKDFTKTFYENETFEKNGFSTFDKFKSFEIIISYFPITYQKRLEPHIKQLSIESHMALSFLLKENDKAKKKEYIFRNTKNIDKLTNIDIPEIHQEINNLSENTLNFIYLLVKTANNEENSNNFAEIPENINKTQVKEDSLRAATNIILNLDHKDKEKIANLTIEILDGLSKEVLFCLAEILTENY